jgi:hypothetical protein
MLSVTITKKIYGPNHTSEVEKVINLCRNLIQEYQERNPKEEMGESSIGRENRVELKLGANLKEFHQWARMNKR